MTTIYEPSIEVLNELTTLVQKNITDINNPKIQNSAFYKAAQTAEFLHIGYHGTQAKLSPEALLLIAQIASTSKTIHTVSIHNNNLGKHGAAIAEAITKSNNVHTISMQACGLGENAPEVAKVIAKSKVKNVDISYNYLGKHAVKTAAELAKSQEIQNIDISHNDLGKDGPATSANLAKLKALQNVNISNNKLGKDGPATAKALTKSKVKNVDISSNELNEDGAATVDVFANSNTIEKVNIKDNSLKEYGQTTETSTQPGMMQKFSNWLFGKKSDIPAPVTVTPSEKSDTAQKDNTQNDSAHKPSPAPVDTNAAKPSAAQKDNTQDTGANKPVKTTAASTKSNTTQEREPEIIEFSTKDGQKVNAHAQKGNAQYSDSHLHVYEYTTYNPKIVFSHGAFWVGYTPKTTLVVAVHMTGEDSYNPEGW
jgi:Ran GTPase-activating protein (RanGAP) involved in mRNA processing and transport